MQHTYSTTHKIITCCVVLVVPIMVGPTSRATTRAATPYNQTRQNISGISVSIPPPTPTKTLTPTDTPRPTPPTMSPADTAPPYVEWILPVKNEQVFVIMGGIVELEVGAFDNSGIRQVYFKRWDAPAQTTVPLGMVTAGPYSVSLDISTLNPG